MRGGRVAARRRCNAPAHVRPHVSDPPRPQIAAFLHFFDVKRDLYVAEVEHVVSDIKEARLYDDMYTKDDVEEIFGDLVAAVKERVRKDLEASASMAALALQQVLTTAEDAGASGDALAVDMTSVEDEGEA